ncbi:EAL domain-containing protein [Spirochaeta africana]|uniref:EAL domain-containing protein n=1 Tax=Spirochaeta africana (strain ATCC 700263 / DSM 8902 / Z-7692) TaxID=889378 RepID=H9UJY4_SPIAZ|nr:EAL domain-containing response regulator [Spirochaeta africana]AFG37827.1 EAL domain-containing protein [Spirochaeta africana DSM 8902]
MKHAHTPVLLIVDDSASSRKVLREVLRDLPVEIVEENNGRSGAERALQILPDLILMDYRMPVMDGPEAVAQIRSHQLAARIPILMITGETASDKMLSSFQSGVLDFIHKPFDPVQLKAQVESYLRLAEINRRFVLATMDRVTERPNMMALQEDVDDEGGCNPLLFLRSKEVAAVRRLYGAEIGDQLERSVCARIEDIAGKMFRVACHLYVIDRGSLVLRFIDPDGYIDSESAPTIMRTFEHHLGEEEFEVENLLFTCEFRMVVSLPGPTVLDDGMVAFEDGRDAIRGPSMVFAGEVVAQRRETIHANLQTLTTIRNSLREDQVLAYAQPLVDLRSGNTIGYECLMRIRDAAGLVLTPYQFLDVAKSSRYYPDMTLRMLDQARRVFSDSSCKCSLNYSIVDVENKRVVERTIALLKEYPRFARNLIIELVEQEDGSDFNLIGGFIQQLRDCGAQVAIDDFGSGYSNLRRLVELDFTYVKIDGSLVRDIVTSERSQQLVNWVVDFARQADIELIAEFVETEEHRQRLLEMGVTLGQGYLYGRPVALTDILAGQQHSRC